MTRAPRTRSSGSGPTWSCACPGSRAGGASIDKEARWLPYVGDRVSDHPVARRHDPGAAGDESLSWYRGVPLWELDEDFRESVEECRGLALDLDLDLDLDEVLRVWDLAAEGSRTVESAPTWYHGDLLAENLLVQGDRLSAVLDFGGLSIGDPAVDLAVAWEVLDHDERREFRRALDVDHATWTASRGWALLIAVITFPYYDAAPLRRPARDGTGGHRRVTLPPQARAVGRPPTQVAATRGTPGR